MQGFGLYLCRDHGVDVRVLPAPSRPPDPTPRPATTGWGMCWGDGLPRSGELHVGLRYQSHTYPAALMAAGRGVRDRLLSVPNERAYLGRLSFERSPVA